MNLLGKIILSVVRQDYHVIFKNQYRFRKQSVETQKVIYICLIDFGKKTFEVVKHAELIDMANELEIDRKDI